MKPEMSAGNFYCHFSDWFSASVDHSQVINMTVVSGCLNTHISDGFRGFLDPQVGI